MLLRRLCRLEGSFTPALCNKQLLAMIAQTSYLFWDLASVDGRTPKILNWASASSPTFGPLSSSVSPVRESSKTVW